jgi:hypothetical protein
MDMIRQSAPSLCSVEVSLQISSEKLQTCLKLFEDVWIAHVHHLVMKLNWTESEYPVIGQVYLDPVAIYMEKFFITEPQSISNIYVDLQDYQAPYDEDQAQNHFKYP